MKFDDANTVEISWNKTFPNIPPIAYTLRENLKDNWFRIYSLPNGKRSPTNKTEEKEVIFRHNSVYNFIFKKLESKILLLVPLQIYENNIEKFKKRHFNEIKKMKLINCIDNSYSFEDYFFKIFYRYFDKKIQFYKKIVHLTLRDKILSPIILELDSNNMICPYNGGIDVFVFDLIDLELAKKEFADWLSDHPLGL